MIHPLSRLGLGTVQFGQAYGISNTRGRVPLEDARTILSRAAAAGMRTLDTAAGYGEAEHVLGALASVTKPFRIVTKTIPLKNGLEGVLERTRQSVAILHRRPVDVLLVHAAGDLIGREGEELWRRLKELRDEGLFRSIGISAYVADDPIALARRFGPDVMQVPLSLLDQRLVHSGALKTLKELGVEIHARSLFLQGLLFLDEDRLPANLAAAAPHLRKVRALFKEAGVTALQAALAFALGTPEVDVGIVGVTTPGELEEIIAAAGKPIPEIDWAACAFDDPVVLTPSLW
ncbi:MAG TPA: aldo/keto reductase [Rhizomicrobium sp.]|nr:aldo/keto reductase [Rhizomicrobium sp.]